MSKNIVVLSDGTGQIGGKGHDTNIYKMFRMLEDRTERQIVFYDEGLGTDWRKVTGNAFGAGFSKNLLECYKFIYDNYNAGDRIYLLGFSRGAATVRSLASFIHFFGILPRSRPGLIKEAFKLYAKGQEKPGAALISKADSLYRKSRDQAYKLFKGDKDATLTAKSDPSAPPNDEDEREAKLNKKATDFVHEHPNQWAQIEFLGVWDTVPALGVVALAGLNSFLGKFLKYNFHNFKLQPSVKNAYHALAIDDERLWFHPSLWTEKTRADQIVEQVWFSGAHTDIGGGFVEAGLSDITLEWMLQKAVSHGLRIYLGSRRYWNFVVAPDATDMHHDPRSGFGKVYKKGDRNSVWFKQGENTTAEYTFGPPVIHESVLERLNRQKPVSDKGYWFLNKNLTSQDEGFKKFLRRKYYEHLRFEWNKINSWIERPLSFDEWLTEYHADYLKSGEADFHKKFSMAGYKDWINEEGGAPDWLEKEYPPFKDWLVKHTRQFSGDNKTYYVEPFGKLEDINFPEPLQDVLVLDEAGLEGNLEVILKAYPKFSRGFLEERLREIRREFPKSLRDYDPDKLKALLKDKDGNPIFPVKEIAMRSLLRRRGTIVKITLDETALSAINSEFKNLIRRGTNESRARQDRIGYDLKRWDQ